MKNRRRIIVAFMLCAVMLLGIGYATLTDVLDITGSADVNKAAAENSFNKDIHFDRTYNSNAGALVHEPGNTASINVDNDDKASFTANNLQGAGDSAKFTFQIINEGDLDASVTPRISSNTNEEYFTIASDWNGATKTLSKDGGKQTYTVTVTLTKTPTDTIAGSFIIELTATSVDPVTPEP